MKKYLVIIEFRCNFTSKGLDKYLMKRLTVGVFDDLEDAVVEGNKSLEVVEKHYKINPKSRDRFSKGGGWMGSKRDLVVHRGGPVEIYAKISTLEYLGLEETLTEIEKELEEV